MATTFNNIAKSNDFDSDELYTPMCLVEIIKPFFEDWLNRWYSKNNRKPIVWCPFDTEKSSFVKFFQRYNNINLVWSHLIDEDGDGHFTGDFFEKVKTQDFDIVISNPPFSEKLRIFQILDEKNKPWALICNMMAINYQEIGSHFVDHPVGFIIPDKKVSFDGNTASFCSGYYCSDSFFSGNKFVHLEDNNSKQYFKPSEMISELELILFKKKKIKELEELKLKNE